VLSPEGLAVLSAIDPEKLSLVPDDMRLGMPVAGIRQIIGIGLNYREHAAEAGFELPKEPIVFQKAIGSLTGPNDGIVLPEGATKVDWEAELGVIIGRQATGVLEPNALQHVAGYCIVNDLSERSWQLERGGQWNKGKSFDGFCPVGPWLVTQDEVPDPQRLDLWLDVNDQLRQHSNTADMIFTVAQIVSYVSQFMTLFPGDLITTGTPAGVGHGLRPPRFLAAGDVVRVGISGLGVQRQDVLNRGPNAPGSRWQSL
jgi:2-keto-4-pentenoate hydratase/2-oxohepta-3-ene-1,7-dioic acid hydratase in catechol pathway